MTLPCDLTSVSQPVRDLLALVQVLGLAPQPSLAPQPRLAAISEAQIVPEQNVPQQKYSFPVKGDKVLYEGAEYTFDQPTIYWDCTGKPNYAAILMCADGTHLHTHPTLDQLTPGAK